MMLVYNLRTHLFICLEEDLPFIGELKKLLKKPFIEKNLLIWSINQLTIESLGNYKISKEFEIIKYLDYFFLFIHTNNYIKREQLFNNLYKFLGNNYEMYIDTERNKDNITNLCNILKKSFFLKDQAKVLDFGCGTGISLDVTSTYNFNITGFDFCDVMCEIASLNGMKVWNSAEIMEQPKDCIDAVFSSYVFHLIESSSYLSIIPKILKSNGIVVANFHKSKNIRKISSYFVGWGFKELYFEKIKNSDNHGKYIAYVKLK